MSSGKSFSFFQMFPAILFNTVTCVCVCVKGPGRCWPSAAQWPWPGPQPGRYQKGTSEAAARLQTSPFQQVSRAGSQLCIPAGQKSSDGGIVPLCSQASRSDGSGSVLSGGRVFAAEERSHAEQVPCRGAAGKWPGWLRIQSSVMFWTFSISLMQLIKLL